MTTDDGRKPAPTRPAHRPTILDDDVKQRLLAAVKAGAPMVLAAEHAGIADRTFRLWMSKGAQVLWDLEENNIEPEDDGHRAYMNLYVEVTQARAQRAVADVALVHRSAEGGAVIEETTRRYRDPDSGQVVEERTVRKAPPDWRAAAWYLERQYRHHGFGKEPQQVELTGAGGGPVQIEGGIAGLAERLHSMVAGAAAVAALEPAPDSGDGVETVDGELVD